MTRQIDRAAAVTASVMHIMPCASGPGDFATGPRLERLVERVHLLGPRPLAELLAEIATATGQPDLIAGLIEEYSRLDPAVLRAVGGDKFPPTLMEVM